MVWESMERGGVMQQLEDVVQGNLKVAEHLNTPVQRPKMLGNNVEVNGNLHGSQFGKVATETLSNSSWKSATQNTDFNGRGVGETALRGKRKKQGEQAEVNLEGEKK
ncbi:hypothetical protein FH972_005269 [Carpinus fangiana]|uniref:Uncharacterized protein n=1 Tax=Carpinus fangiana TaxID=176857 RepID=A0A5N6QRM5_9ROSI|nr:hypothetical protein FH972_005269 [Carpinus fangiana]